MIALLMIEGDPDSILQGHITNKTIPNLYLNNIHVRKGFCRVLDCDVFDVVFSENEIPQLLESLRINRHILKPSGDIIAIQ